jgi:hypothetical protein
MKKYLIILALFAFVLNVFADTNTHFHGGKSHSHALPSQGIKHRHGSGQTGDIKDANNKQNELGEFDISKVPAGKYTIQLLASSSKERAMKLAAKMSKEAYIAYITESKRQGKKLYRVRVGSYKSRQQAVTAQMRMKEKYDNFFIQNSLVLSFVVKPSKQKLKL